MSHPIKRWKFALTRCDCVKCETALTIEETEENCGWVRWHDVASLAAKNERLRMAGDQMAKEINDAQKYMSEGYPEEVWASIDAWKAAKEGGAK